MINETLKKILSLNGISLLIGIVGGVVGLLSIFIDWNSTITIKWLAALLIFFSFLLLISILVVFELYKNINTKLSPKIHVLKFSSEHSMLLVDSAIGLEFSQTVSVFYVFDDFQIPLARGFVVNIQEKFTQIKIIEFDKEFMIKHESEYHDLLNNKKQSLELILIKNYYRYNE